MSIYLFIMMFLCKKSGKTSRPETLLQKDLQRVSDLSLLLPYIICGAPLMVYAEGFERSTLDQVMASRDFMYS